MKRLWRRFMCGLGHHAWHYKYTFAFGVAYEVCAFCPEERVVGL